MLLLAHAYIRFTSAKSEQPESSTVVYRLIDNGHFVLLFFNLIGRENMVRHWNIFYFSFLLDYYFVCRFLCIQFNYLFQLTTKITDRSHGGGWNVAIIPQCLSLNKFTLSSLALTKLRTVLKVTSVSSSTSIVRTHFTSQWVFEFSTFNCI